MNLKFPYSKSPIARFLDELGCESSYPGGGSGAALVAATGSALVEMVVRINAKRSINKSQPVAKNSLSEIKKIRLELQQLMTQDAQAFQRISKFFKTKDQRTSYQKALKHGAQVPLKICELTSRAMTLGCSETKRTSRWLASDLAESGILLEAAFDSARLNVEINLRSINDRNFVVKTRSQLINLAKKISLSRKKLAGVFQI